MDVLAFALLRMGFANRVLRGIHRALVGAPSIGLEAGHRKRRQERLQVEQHLIWAAPKDIRSHGPPVVLNRVPSPSWLRLLAHRAPHLIEF